jgi:hypothetical protein
MNYSSELDQQERTFLAEIYRCAGEDPAASVSMYEIGEKLGMDRQESARIAEMLLAGGLLDLRSLSGAVALTQSGHEAAAAAQPSDSEGAFSLGDGPLLDADRQQVVATIIADLKQQAGKMGLEFDALSEMVADLKTIEAQLNSPRPKTAVIRPCFESIRDLLQGTADTRLAGTVTDLLAR